MFISEEAVLRLKTALLRLTFHFAKVYPMALAREREMTVQLSWAKVI